MSSKKKAFNLGKVLHSKGADLFGLPQPVVHTSPRPPVTYSTMEDSVAKGLQWWNEIRPQIEAEEKLIAQVIEDRQKQIAADSRKYQRELKRSIADQTIFEVPTVVNSPRRKPRSNLYMDFFPPGLARTKFPLSPSKKQKNKNKLRKK